MPKIKFNEANRPYYSDDFIKGFECGAERQYEADHKTGRWIPVSERLPEYGESVITVNSDDDYEINHIIDDDLNEWFYDGVIAWMPLPEPYKVESEGVNG